MRFRYQQRIVYAVIASTVGVGAVAAFQSEPFVSQMSFTFALVLLLGALKNLHGDPPSRFNVFAWTPEGVIFLYAAINAAVGVAVLLKSIVASTVPFAIALGALIVGLRRRRRRANSEVAPPVD